MKKIEKLRDYLLENYVDKDGDLFLQGLDFSDFDGDVHIGCMKVKKDLHQECHTVQGDLYQEGHEVQGTLYQENKAKTNQLG